MHGHTLIRIPFLLIHTHLAGLDRAWRSLKQGSGLRHGWSPLLSLPPPPSSLFMVGVCLSVLGCIHSGLQGAGGVSIMYGMQQLVEVAGRWHRTRSIVVLPVLVISLPTFPHAICSDISTFLWLVHSYACIASSPHRLRRANTFSLLWQECVYCVELVWAVGQLHTDNGELLGMLTSMANQEKAF